LRERDERGRDRAYLLLQPAADAIVIDSTSLTLNEVLNRTEDLVRPLFA
jgi:cytidylate kinase